MTRSSFVFSIFYCNFQLMKLVYFLFSILFTFCFVNCKTLSTSSSMKSGKDSIKIFIHGTIRAYQTLEPIGYAGYMVHPTDTGSIRRGSVRHGTADKYGIYKIDITSLVDSTEIIVLRSIFINCALSQIIIKGKIKKSVPLDIEIMYGIGDFTREYIIDPRNSKLTLVKQTVNVKS